MGLVATLLPIQARQERVHAALHDRHELLPCDSWEALIAACGRRAVTVALVDLLPTTPPSNQAATFEEVRQLKRRYPSVSVVLYAALPPARPRDLFEAGRFGFDGLVLVGVDDVPRQLREIVDLAEARGALALLRPAVAGVAPAVRDAVLLCVTRAHQLLSPDELAGILGLRRKVVSARLARAGFPTTQRMIAWGRLIVAGRLLEDPERTADSVALALDYPSGSAFRNACQRYARAAPHEIRSRGGASYVVGQLLSEVRPSDPIGAVAITSAAHPPSAPP